MGNVAPDPVTAHAPIQCVAGVVAEVKVSSYSDDKILAAVRAKNAEEEATFTRPATKPAFTFNELLGYAKGGEAGDAKFFVRLSQGKIAKDHAADVFYRWGEHHWELDELNEALANVEALIPYYTDAARECFEQELKDTRAGNKEAAQSNKDTKEIFLKKIACLQRRRYRQDVLVLAAAGEGSLGITGREWDRDPYLLPFKNGVLDLKTRLFRPGQPEDYIKTFCPTVWRGLDAPAPRWEKFLWEILDGDLDLIAYLKRLLGYGIAGLTVEHNLPILWGPEGRNGKGSLLEVLGYVLGPLAGPVQGEMLLEQRNPRSSAAPSPDTMALRGKRLCWASETDDGRRLNNGRVKLLCGGDTLSGRNPYGKREVTFPPTHTLLMLTNFRPHVDSGDNALWERIHLIEFKISFVDQPIGPNQRPRDKNLLSALKQEASGIAASLVAGFSEWQDKGLMPPSQVMNATSKYRKGEDLIEQFFEESCVIKEDAFCGGAEIFNAYQGWCDERGTKSRRKKFYEKLTARFNSKKSNSGKIYMGIGLLISGDGMTV